MGASEEARLLMIRAADDVYVLDRLLEDPAAPDSVFGFHAQQAAEKLLKAALFLVGAAPPRTHQLTLLIDLAKEKGLPLPSDAEDLGELTPYAVIYRYGEVEPMEEEPLERKKIRSQVRSLRAWVEAMKGSQ
jgi:HEPN domain-containing protein